MARSKTSLRFGLIAAGILLSAAGFSQLRRVPVVGEAGCGPTALLAVSRRLGVAISSPRFFDLFGGDVALSSHSFDELQEVARRVGLQARGWQMTVDELRQSQPLGVLHIGGNHFVAVTDYSETGVLVADPVAKGQTRSSWWSYRGLGGRWNGRILVVSRARKSKPH